jgi:hypothetical protein
MRDGSLGSTVRTADRLSLLEYAPSKGRKSRVRRAVSKESTSKEISSKSTSKSSRSSKDSESPVGRQVAPADATFLARVRREFMTPEDVDVISTIYDPNVKHRQEFTCTACQGDSEKGPMVVSTCCFAFSCASCMLQFLSTNEKRCMHCNINWGPFHLADVLCAPPCADFSSLTDQMKDRMTTQWNQAVQTLTSRMTQETIVVV